MAAFTWGRLNGLWSSSTSWRPFATPGSLDSATFGALDSSTVTLESIATITSVTLASGSQVTLRIDSVLTVLGRFEADGGTIELEPGGTISGGTIDLASTVFVVDGGVIDRTVLVGTLGGGIAVTAASLAATEAARQGAALSVSGALGLVAGTYDAALSLDGYGASVAPELDAVSGMIVFASDARLTLSQDDPSHTPGHSPSGPGPVLGGGGTFDNLGLIVSDALAATIDAASFVNAGSIALNDAHVSGLSEYFLSVGTLTWDATLAPSLTLEATRFANSGTITGQGATLDVVGGSFVNSGNIDLGQASSQGPLLLPLPRIATLLLVSTLDIGAGVTSFANTGTLAAGTIQIDANVSLAALGTLAGMVVFNGTLDLGGGTLDAATLGASTSYVLNGTVIDGTILDTNGRIVTQSATLDNVNILFAQPTTLSNVLGPGTVVLSDDTNELAYTSASMVTGLTVQAELQSGPGVISIQAGSVTFGASTMIANTVAGTRLSVGGGVFVENGSIQLSGSELTASSMTGSGTVTLGAGAVLTVSNLADAAALTIVFGTGASELVLPGNASGLGQLGMRLLGLAAGDLIDFAGVSSSPGASPVTASAVISGGFLRVVGASGEQASMATAQSDLVLQTAADANGGTIVTVACFRHGTNLSTPEGEMPVERLRIGDRVLTRGGAARRIKWLGRRAYTKALVGRQKQLRPVRFSRGALGPGLPRRTLDVSPLHAVLIRGVLVPAAALVNGRTIRRAPVADTAYVHVELDAPDILLAEGVPTESYVDCDNRGMFDNAAEFASLYPGEVSRRWAFPVPRVEEGWALEDLRRDLAQARRSRRAPGVLRGHVDLLSADRLEGWVMDTRHPGEPLELEVLVGGRQLQCLVANRYRIDLDHAGLGDGVCGFTADLPGLDATCLATLTLARLSDGALLAA